MRLAATTLALTLLATAPASATPFLRTDSHTPPKRRTVTVEKGETLAEIAATHPGGWRRTAFVNDLADPNLVYPGQVLLVPRKNGRKYVLPPRPAVGVSRSQPAATEAQTGAGGLNWQALFECESGNDPTAVSASGTYRGLAQFSLATFHSLGYSGDPIDYSYAEQAEAAQRLYDRSGPGQWPVCGRLL